MVTEIPSNIALKHLKPSRFIPAVMLVWVRNSLVHSPTSSYSIIGNRAGGSGILTTEHSTGYHHDSHGSLHLVWRLGRRAILPRSRRESAVPRYLLLPR